APSRPSPRTEDRDDQPLRPGRLHPERPAPPGGAQQPQGLRPHGAGPADADLLGPDEIAFIAERDSFYLASVGETGWPYVQHRGGPPGFLHALDPGTLAFVDYRGNRQYITVGNLDHDDRISLLFMDYPARARLKVYGRARAVDPPEAGDLLARL
ncbi:pyridoxamine 5'-phosphate oxidase family protein, partial [Streptomyces radiopugnans]|uniref:pyridoxamine 5'-phosphate oxidase family protein n=1 Tax=Streptomyces radiopugnans TaxID=403935 RepID=UPI003F19DFC2